MRILSMFIVAFLFVACNSGTDLTDEKSVEEILETGEWRIVTSDKPFDRFYKGLKFSKDNQVFSIDSQGQVVAPPHERIYSLSDDTMKIVDYRYEPKFLYEKGTDVLLIKKITKDKLYLEALYPNGPIHIELKHQD